MYECFLYELEHWLYEIKRRNLINKIILNKYPHINQRNRGKV
jgi:hypothetical protein